MSSRTIELISERLRKIDFDYFPSDFSRKPKPLKVFKFWKATQLRYFLIYLGPVVLIDLLPSFELYEHFLVLHCAIYILANDKLSQVELWKKYAKDLLNWFVSQLSRLYWPQILVYNFHNLLLLVDDVDNFGPLDNFAAFPFENFLRKMKRMVRSHKKPLEQVAKRLLERQRLLEKDANPLLENSNSSSVYFNGTRLQCAEGPKIADSCFLSKSNEIVIVKSNVKEESSGSQVFKVLCQPFMNKCDFYTLKNFKSSNMGIWKVKKLGPSIYLSLTDLSKKCMILPCFNDMEYYVCIPYVNMNESH